MRRPAAGFPCVGGRRRPQEISRWPRLQHLQRLQRFPSGARKARFYKGSRAALPLSGYLQHMQQLPGCPYPSAGHLGDEAVENFSRHAGAYHGRGGTDATVANAPATPRPLEIPMPAWPAAHASRTVVTVAGVARMRGARLFAPVHEYGTAGSWPALPSVARTGNRAGRYLYD
jgi:hypothetical protein